MNAEGLLRVYKQISEAPDAVARLRRFVLDLAVRGQLVEQDAADESASVLLSSVGPAEVKDMSQPHSTSTHRRYGTMRVCDVWGEPGRRCTSIVSRAMPPMRRGRHVVMVQRGPAGTARFWSMSRPSSKPRRFPGKAIGRYGRGFGIRASVPPPVGSAAHEG